MTQDGDTSPRPTAAPLSAEQRATRIDLARAGGAFLTAVGVLDGLLMTLKRREAPCPDGKYFPEGTTDFQCYTHPLGMQGVAVMVVSLLLGLLVLLTCAIAQNSAARSSIG